MERHIFSVTEVNELVKLLLDNEPMLSGICVRGEISNYKMYPSGHHYFTLKDAGGALRCVMFRSSAARLRFRPENGMKVIAFGRIGVFPRDGAYQLYCNTLTADGAGDLYVAFEQLKEKLTILLLPRDPNDSRNVILEIRGGVGGEESALFAHSLFRMYSMYAAKMGWSIELMNLNETELGGVKEADFIVSGRGAYSRLKYESGVHRVQRVPETESGGRVHTSTATVAVLPEMEEVDVQINPADIEMQVYRSSGAGGQHINKTSSAVRLIHKPTGIVVACQEERSQIQNREKCMRMLASKLYEMEQERLDSEVTGLRRSQVGTGMRNERIRTYNFPQGRVTDHRVGLTLYRIDAIMDGDLDEIINALATADQAEKLREH